MTRQMVAIGQLPIGTRFYWYATKFLPYDPEGIVASGGVPPYIRLESGSSHRPDTPVFIDDPLLIAAVVK